MGFDDLVNKAQDLAEEHKDQINTGLDKAADLAKDKFGHDEQIDKAVDFVQDKLGE